MGTRVHQSRAFRFLKGPSGDNVRDVEASRLTQRCPDLARRQCHRMDAHLIDGSRKRVVGPLPTTDMELGVFRMTIAYRAAPFGPLHDGTVYIRSQFANAVELAVHDGHVRPAVSRWEHPCRNPGPARVIGGDAVT